MCEFLIYCFSLSYSNPSASRNSFKSLYFVPVMEIPNADNCLCNLAHNKHWRVKLCSHSDNSVDSIMYFPCKHTFITFNIILANFTQSYHSNTKYVIFSIYCNCMVTSSYMLRNNFKTLAVCSFCTKH